jgi:phenylalanyl-tRNA synthetase beta chain
MKVRIGWLKDYVVLSETPTTIANILLHLGLPPEGLTPWGADSVLDLEVTVNRPDCLSHLGVARELSAWLERPLEPGWRSPEEKSDQPVEERVSVHIEAPDGCLRYVARVIEDVRVGESPDWLKDRLESVGVRPVNNVVDVTNYVMLAYGQPLHAFDLDTVRGNRIVVRWARPGESLQALDENVYSLTPEILVIADAQRPIALAGIIGGLETSVRPDTRRVLLESAWFEPRAIRRGRRRLGLQTEASYRFERGTDPEMAPRAADHAAALIQAFAGGRVLAGRVDVNLRPWSPRSLRLRYERVQQFLNVAIPPDWIEKRLQGLGFRVARIQNDPAPIWEVAPPSFRADVQEETDLLEEIARHYGYERVPLTLPVTERKHQPDYPGFSLERAARRVLQGLGLHETISTSFYSEQPLEVFSVTDPLRVANPLSDRRACLRRWIGMGLVEAAQRNHQYGVTDVRLWEIGQVFWDAQGLPQEACHLGLILSGFDRPARTWRDPARPVDFFDLKGLVQAFLETMGWRPVTFAPSDYPFLHPYQQAEVQVRGQRVGFLGAFHPRWVELYDLRMPVYLAELDWDTLRTIPTAMPVFQEWSRLPAIVRDISIVVPASVPYAAIEQALAEARVPELAGWDLIDRYAGVQIPADCLSYTIRLTFHPQAPRSSEEVDGRIQHLLAYLSDRLGARLRTE